MNAAGSGRAKGVLAAFVVLLLGASGAWTGARAQEGGRVFTASGEALPNVTVEVWGRAEVLHVTDTDGWGRFTLPDLDRRRITRYVFRHLGFGVLIIQRDDFRDGMDVRMVEEPAFELEGLEATVSRDVCPQDDDAEARGLWERAAAGYERSTSRHGIGGRYRAEQKDVNERFLLHDLKGELEVDLALWEGWSAGEKVVEGRVLTLEEVAPRLGYAWPRELEEPEYRFGRDRHLNWVYAALDTRSANHFVTRTFGELHTFAVVEESDATVRLRFCSVDRDRERPYLRGTLLVGRDGSLQEADWRFETPDPVEDAGGWVSFTTARDPHRGPPHLVADRGLFFRHNGFDRMYPDMPRWVFRELREWRGWTVAPGAAEPPRRRAGPDGSWRRPAP